MYITYSGPFSDVTNHVTCLATTGAAENKCRCSVVLIVFRSRCWSFIFVRWLVIMWSSFLVMQDKVKLSLSGLEECPYRLAADLWEDDPTQWPSLEYGDLYNYLVDKLVSNLLLSFFRCRKIVPDYYPRCRFRDNPKYDGISCRSSAGFSGEAMKNYKSLQAHQFFRSGFVGPVRRGSWYCKVCRLKKKQTV